MNTDSTDLNKYISFYKQMYTIGFFEETTLRLFSEGLLNGTTHTSIGQEANAVGIISNLNADKDIVFSNHRGHGHYLSFTNDIKGILFEIMGLPTGVCGGIGGSQHLYNSNFYSNGIQGGMIPTAVGAAYAEKLNNNNSIAVGFLGDGTLGQGIVYESFNLASLWNIPVLFVIENNRYAQSTPIKMQVSGKISNRPKAFNVKTTELNTTDVIKIHSTANTIISEIKDTSQPHCLIINTYRFSAHSKGDDFRNKNEIEHYKKKDPLLVFRNKFNDFDYNLIQFNIETSINNFVKEGIKQIKNR